MFGPKPLEFKTLSTGPISTPCAGEVDLSASRIGNSTGVSRNWGRIDVAQAYGKLVEHPWYQMINDHLVALSTPRPCERILDLGCGPGSNSKKLLEHLEETGSLISIDVCRMMIHEAQKRIDSLKPVGTSLAFMATAGNNIDQVISTSLDKVFLFNSLHHMEDPAEVIAKISNLLVPGGQVAINLGFTREAVPHSSRAAMINLVRAIDYRVPEAKEARRLAQQAGRQTKVLATADCLEMLKAAGLEIVHQELKPYLVPKKCIKQFLKVPEFGEDLLPSGTAGLTDSQRLEIIRDAYKQSHHESGNEGLQRNWLYLVAQKPLL